MDRLGKYFGSLAFAMVFLMVFFMAMMPFAAMAETYSYYIPITVFNNSTASYSYLPVIVSVNNTQFVTLGYINSDGLNTNVVEANTNTSRSYMLASAKNNMVVPTLLPNQSVVYNYRLNDAPGQTGFPVITGYSGNVTATDDPSLELGNRFTILLNGYIDTSLGAGKNLIYKNSAFVLNVTAAGSITANVLSVVPKSVTAAGVSSGVHSINVTADNTDNLKIYVDGTLKGTTALVGQTVPNNANDWYFMQKNVAGYLDYLKVTTSGFGVGGFYGIEPAINVTPPVKTSWETVDVSAYVPLGATGVILHIDNTAGSDNIGLRHIGSADNIISVIGDHLWGAVGLDANRQFQCYVNGVATMVYLNGYTMGGITFLTNGVDITPAQDVWTTVNVAATAPNALGVILEVWQDPVGIGPAGTNMMGARMHGSTDDLKKKDIAHGWVIVGCDSSQQIDIYNGSNFPNPEHYHFNVVGYITAGATFFANGVEKSAGLPIAAWTDIDCAASAPNAAMLFFNVWDTSAANWAFGLRENGSAENIYSGGGTQHVWSMVACDSNQIVEGKIANALVDFYLIGYGGAAPSGTEAVWYQPSAMISGATLPDRSGNGNTGTINWGTNPTGITVSLGPLTPYQPYIPPGGTDEPPVPSGPIVTPPEIPTVSTDEPVNMPMYDSVHMGASSLGWSTKTLYGLLIIMTAVAMAFGVIMSTGSLLAGGITAFIFLGAGAATPVMSIWIAGAMFMTVIFCIFAMRWT